MPGRYTFGKRDRLQRGSEFRRVYEQGRKVVGRLLVLYALELPAPAVAPPRVGVVSSRKLGGAVQRNRARRLIREAWRLHRPKLNRQNVQLVLAARVAIVGHPRQAVDAELGKLLAAAGLIGS